MAAVSLARLGYTRRALHARPQGAAPGVAHKGVCKHVSGRPRSPAGPAERGRPARPPGAPRGRAAQHQVVLAGVELEAGAAPGVQPQHRRVHLPPLGLQLHLAPPACSAGQGFEPGLAAAQHPDTDVGGDCTTTAQVYLQTHQMTPRHVSTGVRHLCGQPKAYRLVRPSTESNINIPMPPV